MTNYYPVIGLEIHAEMKTESKMFCACKNDPFVAQSNTYICPVCTGQPGAMPYVNAQAIRNVLKVGAALDGDFADFTEFDRKNYFYPDMPKAYQISQYQYPLVSGGSLNGVELIRIHMEEDTATSTHVGDTSLVDFNRSGVPLMELVTEPVVYDAETAVAFAKELQLLLRTLGVGDAHLEKGEMRIEANISLTTDSERKPEHFNPAVEIKNLNSFRIVAAAIEYEIKRQTDLYERGEVQIKETRGWDENKNQTFSQRAKETADDYRYFPDPDIPKFKLSEIEGMNKEAVTATLPELPWDKRTRYTSLGLAGETTEFFLQNPRYDVLLQGSIEDIHDTKIITKTANYISSDIAGIEGNHEIKGGLENISVESMRELIAMVVEGELSSRGAKDTLLVMYQEGGMARDIAESKKLIQQNDEEGMKALVEQIVADNPDQFVQFKDGEEKLIAFFVGQAMKASGGAVNPQIISKLIKEM